MVFVYSKEAVEAVIVNGKFPRDAAVISISDSKEKNVSKEYSHVDYSSVCDMVFNCKIDNLDIDHLQENGYTYDTFFSEADALAKFIVKAYMEKKNIICQCDDGRTLSAGCAAAIMEYFYEKGVLIFSDYSYSPNQVLFHKVYDSLVKINPIYNSSLEFPDKPGRFLDFSTGATTLYSKKLIEEELTEKGKCYHSVEEAFYQLRHGMAKVYVDLHIDGAVVCNGHHQGEYNIGLKKYFTYSNKEIPLIVVCPWIMKYIKNKDRNYYYDKLQCSIGKLKRPLRSPEPISFDILGIMELDCKEPVIEKAIITNIFNARL